MLVKCENCGIEFEKGPSQVKKRKHHFCSPDCFGEWRRNRIKVECENCGKEFEKKPYDAKKVDRHFCSRECHAEFMEDKVEVECKNCGKKFEKKPRDTKRVEHHFCSRKCYAEFKENKVKLECETCGKKFEKTPNEVKKRKHHFCSRECFHKWERNRVEAECENCGRKFEKKPFDAKKVSHHFCSRECWAEFQKDRVKLKCNYCGEEFEKVPNKVRNRNFCLEDCKVKFFNEHGWPSEIDESDIDGEAILEKDPEDLGYVLGCLVGDGWITTEHRVCLAARDREFVLRFKESLENLKGRKVTFFRYEDDIGGEFTVKDKTHESYEMFMAMSASKELYFQLKPLYEALLNHQEIPVEEEAFKRELIAGFYDSEGSYYIHVYDRGRSHQLRIYNSNQKLLKFFQNLIQKEAGVKFKLRKRTSDDYYLDVTKTKKTR